MPSLGAGVTDRTPESNSPFLGGVPLIYAPLTTLTCSTASTITAAQLLKGVLPINCTDTGTATLPTATLLNAAIPGVRIGTGFHVWVVNPGDSTLTLAVGTGLTLKVIDSEDAVVALATHYAGHYYFSCTGVEQPNDPSTSDSWDIYGFGTAVATA
jgi:hypothetical protein